MKYCSKCKANVEGLVYRCDCCGALLEQQKRFFTCSVYELPQCLEFSAITREMVNGLQPKNVEKYEDFLDGVGIRMICYPEWMLTDGNIKKQVRYSSKKKYVQMTVVVNYNDYIDADRKGKANLVATAILQGIHLLQMRLDKDKLNIDGIVIQAEKLLKKYIT